ncbi:MAG: pentapeptide repeat-containing protein, partial [Proteobacteria bacterium]|nr:pentapeptide repeat-containing protein [Pseudomonadota bacterium]
RLDDADLGGGALGETDLSAIDLSTAKTATGAGVTDDWLREQLRLHETWVTSGARQGQRADFIGLDLSGRDLSGAMLAAAGFEAATLVGANLSRTMLAAANLRGANLLRANLSGADLRGADLMDTNMRDADFTNCKKGQLPGTALITLLQQAG